MKTSISFKHVNEFRDRHGKMRRYFRRPGQKAIRLSGELGSMEFAEAYHTALTNMPVREIGRAHLKAGTVNAVIATYYTSRRWLQMAEGTQRNHRTALERFRTMFGEQPIGLMTKKHVLDILDKMDPIPGRNWLVAVRALMQYAIKRELRKDDPTEGVKPHKPEKKTDVDEEDGYPTWSEEEIAQYEAYWPVGSFPRLALALCLYTAQRASDVIRMGKQHIKNETMSIKQKKTKKWVYPKIDPRLRDILDNTPGCNERLIFLTTVRGKGYATTSSFGASFRSWAEKAGLKDRTAHGLRKAWCRRAAEAGLSAPQMQSITGHETLRELERYIWAASRKLMAQQAINIVSAERR